MLFYFLLHKSFLAEFFIENDKRSFIFYLQITFQVSTKIKININILLWSINTFYLISKTRRNTQWFILNTVLTFSVDNQSATFNLREISMNISMDFFIIEFPHCKQKIKASLFQLLFNYLLIFSILDHGY